MADLLAAVVLPAGASNAGHLAEYLTGASIAGVTAAARGAIMRDDTCLPIVAIA